MIKANAITYSLYFMLDPRAKSETADLLGMQKGV